MLNNNLYVPKRYNLLTNNCNDFVKENEWTNDMDSSTADHDDFLRLLMDL